MNAKKRIAWTLFSVVVSFTISCGVSEDEKAEANVKGPMKTAKELLRLHDLLGVQPELRSEEARKKEVDPEALRQLFVDYDAAEKFLTDLYIGFVVGALARHQDELEVSSDSKRARIVAGNLKVRLVFVDNRWKIHLGETVPDEIKRRALEEKAKFESRN